MKFNTLTTAITFIILFAVLIGGTVMSPMSMSTIAMVSVGLLVFGALSLVIGVKHGKYRASH